MTHRKAYNSQSRASILSSLLQQSASVLAVLYTYTIHISRKYMFKALLNVSFQMSLAKKYAPQTKPNYMQNQLKFWKYTQYNNHNHESKISHTQSIGHMQHKLIILYSILDSIYITKPEHKKTKIGTQIQKCFLINLWYHST